MDRRKSRFDWRAALVGAAVAALFLAAAPVIADVGDAVLVGKFNTGNKKTALSGMIAGDSAFKVANSAADGTGITVQVAHAQAPFVVNTRKRVKNLNADRIDGLSTEDLAPKVLTARDDNTALDISADPTICQTSAYVPTSDELAVISTNVSLEAPGAGSMQWGTKAAVNTDGGGFVPAPPDWWLRVSSATAEYNALTSVGVVELAAGSSYVFGATVTGFTGQTVTDEYICKTTVEISPRVKGTGDITPAPALAAADTSND